MCTRPWARNGPRRAPTALFRFTELPESERSARVLALFTVFSDIYRLDQRWRVERIYKASPDTKVFVGFSFSLGKLGEYLSSLGERAGFSQVMRGYEDDAPSVYIATGAADGLYLMRLNLVYVENFLTQFSRFSGTPAMLVANDGFVMLSGDPTLKIMALDLKSWSAAPSPRRTLSAGGRHWIPIISATSAIGGRIVTLIPTELLTSQRNALLVFVLGFTCVLILLVVIKTRRMNRLIMQPLALFAGKMLDLEVGRHAADATAGEIRFEELADIHTRFHAMAEAIRSREQSLAEATVKAQAASLAKSAFLANMSHEIRTPLNAILGFAQVLERDPELKSGQRESLATIERSGEYLLTLINDILDMAKIEAGRMTLQTGPFDLAVLLDETESLFKQRAHDRALRLSIEQVELPRIVQGDATKLRQVLLNLVGNAVKFTSAGTVKLRAERVGEAMIRFSVEDTGVGIAPEELTRIFEPFTQTESGRQVQGGTGLGLALSAQFVRLMGGELTATSVPGQGSCFSFTLRLPPGSGAEPAVAMEVESEVVGLEPGQPVCRILIVDDLADNRAPLRALLEGVNPHPPVLELREAADGREALAIWEDWQPHLIFMDMRMPVMSGQEATSQIKSRMAERPDRVRSVIVALSASAFDEQRDHFLASGCDEFARKPFRSEEIFDILERLAGVRLSRAAAAEAAETLSTAAASERLCAYPDEWRQALKRALDIGDFVRIEGLLEQIKGGDAALERSLQGWARDYDLDALSTVLNDCGDRAGVGETP